MASTKHDLSPLDEVTLLVTTQNPVSLEGAMRRSLTHDPYCAIHDEYGSCTCGAGYTEEIPAGAQESRLEAMGDRDPADETPSPSRL